MGKKFKIGEFAKDAVKDEPFIKSEDCHFI